MEYIHSKMNFFGIKFMIKSESRIRIQFIRYSNCNSYFLSWLIKNIIEVSENYTKFRNIHQMILIRTYTLGNGTIWNYEINCFDDLIVVNNIYRNFLWLVWFFCILKFLNFIIKRFSFAFLLFTKYLFDKYYFICL